MLLAAVDPDSAKQRALRGLTHHHALLAGVSRGLQVLPWSVKRAAVRLWARAMDGHAVETAAEMIGPQTVQQGFFLGLTEFELLSAPPDWWLLRYFGRRAVVISAPGDTWNPGK